MSLSHKQTRESSKCMHQSSVLQTDPSVVHTQPSAPKSKEVSMLYKVK